MSRAPDHSGEGQGLTAYVVLDLPRGAYHHYCAELCRGLVSSPGVREVCLVAVSSERVPGGIDPEERALLDRRVRLVLLTPGEGSTVRRTILFMVNLVRHVAEVFRGSPAIVHVHTATGRTLLDVGMLLLYRFSGAPLVRTVHELTAAERTRQPTGWERRLGCWQLRRADAVIVHHEDTRRTVGAWLGSASRPIAVIPHGNYLLFRRESSSAARSAHEGGAAVALFLGVKRHKGLLVFLEALRLLHARRAPVRGVIVGRVNPGDEDLAARIRETPNAQWREGYIPNSMLQTVYEQSDMVVLPYVMGTTSGAIHLAYAFTRPVIVSDLPCFHDLVQDGRQGLIVPRGDAAALAEAMVRLATQPAERNRMGEEGFLAASSPPWSWEDIGRRTVDLYGRAWSARKGGGRDPVGGAAFRRGPEGAPAAETPPAAPRRPGFG